MFRSNPVVKGLREKADGSSSSVATYKGVALKSILLVILTIISALVSATWLLQEISTDYAMVLLFAGVVSFIAIIIASFAPQTAPVAGIIYAIADGFLIGATSALFEQAYSGIVFCALLATAITFGVMSLLYATETIRVTSKLRKFLFTAIISVVVVQVLVLVLALFGVGGNLFGFYFNSFGLQLVVNIGMILLASFMLLIDFEDIRNTVELGLNKRYEWNCALGLLVTLIWLYIRFIRLFAIIANRR